ncbi:MAG: Cell surface protein [Parcubacteria group bacterium GW2011_GWA2_48_9]|nr:MAG: Cell surface protein [Parcubacteria group bacterium GW2011_GWA2_48_9]
MPNKKPMPNNNQRLETATQQKVKVIQGISVGIAVIAGIIGFAAFMSSIIVTTSEQQSTSMTAEQALSDFQSRYGATWTLEMDETLGGQRLEGGKLATTQIVSGVASVEEANIDAISKTFLQDNQALLSVDINNLQIDQTFFDDEVISGTGDSAIIHYKQNYLGVPVKDSKVTLAYFGNALSLVDSNYAILSSLSTTPAVSQGQAETRALDLESNGSYLSILGDATKSPLQIVDAAKSGVLETPGPVALENLSVVDTTLMVYEFPKNSDTYILAWEVTLERKDITSVPVYYFDALIGDLLFREETILEENISGTIDGKYYPTYPSAIRPGGGTAQAVKMRDEDVTLSPSNLSDASNALGQYLIAGVTGSQSLQAKLEGPYVKVVKDGVSDLVHTATVNPPTVHNWDWSTQDTEVYGERSNVFYLINNINAYFTSGSPFDVPLAGQVLAHVSSNCNGTVACNACANRAAREMKFLAAGTVTRQDGSTLTCGATSLGSDIIYHEYAHLINGIIDSGMPGDMHEALADYWASTITNDECVGYGPFPYCIRNLDNTTRYPMYLTGEVHNDSVGFSGALWDFRIIVGETIADPLVMLAEKMDGRTFHSFLNNLITAAGGVTSTHIKNICDSFATNHGIYVSECLNHTSKPIADIITPYETLFTNTSPSVPVNGTAGTAQGGTFTNFQIHYGVGYDVSDVSTWSATGVTLTSGGTSPVNNNVLGNIATSSLNNGWYVLRLTVNDSKGTTYDYSRFRFVGGMHAGWPIFADVSQEGSSAALFDINGDGTKEVIFHDGNSVDARTHNGTLLWEKINMNMSSPTNPAIGDLDLNGQYETVAIYYDDIYAWDKNGNQVWKYTTPDGNYVTPVIADVDPTSQGQEVIIHSGHWFTASIHSIYILSRSGQLLHNWQVPNSSDPGWGLVFPSPAVGDIDGNAQNGVEIVGTFSVNGTPTTYVWDENGNQVIPAKVLNGDANASPVIADINNDGINEIIQSVFEDDPTDGIVENKVYIWNKNAIGGLSGWPVTLPEERDEIYVSPSVADLDGNGTNEIVQPTLWGKIFIWNANGTQFTTPLSGNTCGTIPTRSSQVVLVDLDNDTDLEIVNGNPDGNLYAWHHTRALVAGFPKDIMSFTSSTPAVADIDNDGQLEIAMSSEEGYTYVWDLTTNFNANKQIWPTLHHDNARSNNAKYGICSDGTFAGVCAATKPQYCQTNLTLANNCSICGCTSGNYCSGDGSCQPCSCAGKQCGTNQCGQSCGTCGAGTICSGGSCVPCTPNCTGKVCGSNGCGGSCGSCGSGYSCVNGTSCVSRCRSSFLAGTPITMANGSTKPIEDVMIGDAVKAYDVETGTLVENQVTQYYEYAAETYLIINGDLKITKLHPVYSHGEWVEIGKLKVGDSLTNDQGQPLIIDSIQETNEKVNVYNLEVSPDNTYIAWGIIVHNKPPGACPIPAE